MKLRPNLNVKHEVRIPARTAVDFEVRAGEYVRMTDVCGQQAADCGACSGANPNEWLSAEHTRAYNWRLFPRVGESFCTNHRRPILQLVEDTVGVHDMLICACDAYRYRMYGVEEPHPNCRDNLLGVIKRWGFAHTAIPSPVNWFSNFALASDGTIEPREGASKAGDYVVLKAWIDCVVVVSACPMDLNPVNGYCPTDLVATVLTLEEPRIEVAGG
jgi:uncharacterized protein